MATKKMMEPDKEFEGYQASVAAAARGLQPNHYMWMIDAALAHFMAEIEKEEALIVRHGHFKDEPYPHSLFEHTRESEVKDARRSLEHYRPIVVFLIAMKKLVSHMTAHAFGVRIAEYFRSRKEGE